MAEQENIVSKIQLLVEGNDHRNFFRAFISHLAIEDIQIRSFGGVGELGRYLRAFFNEPGFRDKVECLGIVRDAEDSAVDAIRSVRSSLKRVGLELSEDPRTPSDNRPSVGVLILPGGGRPGMLETLLCETFAGSIEDNCINRFFECIEQGGVGEIKRLDKARAWAYLTTRPDPHHSVGYATAKGYWGELDQPAFDVIREFLKNMCSEDSS